MKVFVAQMNSKIGDISGNTKKIIQILDNARKEKSEIVVFPELVLCGYPPQDLVLFDNFIREIEENLKKIIEKSQNLFIVLGLVRKATKNKGLYNSAAIIADGKLLGFKDKTLLPYYDVFNEWRYFQSNDAQKLWEYKGKKIGVLICEDAWQHASEITNVNYDKDPVEDFLKKTPIDLLLIPVASPYYYKKMELRIKVYSKVAKSLKCPVIVCSQVGANDQLVFDGYSLFLGEKGQIRQIAKGFVEDELIIDTQNEKKLINNEKDDLTDLDLADLYQALVLGVKDYFFKQGFTKACLGLSGGIDSALTACIAVEALGAKNVLALRMPSRFSSLGSIEDAEKIANNLNIKLLDIPIDSLFQHFLDILSPTFLGKPLGTAEENLQARIRGNLLMAVSNKLGHVVLSTGNKSEMAMGYVTLYGDMCGGLSVLGDVSKTMVYKLSRWINKTKEIIPQIIIEKAPSAELKANQKDQDELPTYEIVDKVLQEYVENHKSIEEIVTQHQIKETIVEELVKKIHLAEYKRRQGPPGIRVTKKAFGAGRAFPIVQGWL